MDISGNFLIEVQSIYGKFCYTIKKNMVTTDFQSCFGVKQGRVLSPLLFNMYNFYLPCIFDEQCDPVLLDNSQPSCLMFLD